MSGIAPEDYTRFTIRDMIALVVLPRLDSIDRKLDTKANELDLAKLEQRVTANESWRNRMAGAISLVAAIATTGLVILVRHFGF